MDVLNFLRHHAMCESFYFSHSVENFIMKIRWSHQDTSLKAKLFLNNKLKQMYVFEYICFETVGATYKNSIL